MKNVLKTQFDTSIYVPLDMGLETTNIQLFYI